MLVYERKALIFWEGSISSALHWPHGLSNQHLYYFQTHKGKKYIFLCKLSNFFPCSTWCPKYFAEITSFQFMELVICKFYTFKDIAVTRPLVDATYKMSRAYTWNWSTIKEVIKKKNHGSITSPQCQQKWSLIKNPSVYC